jgi:hypothetical protein
LSCCPPLHWHAYLQAYPFVVRKVLRNDSSGAALLLRDIVYDADGKVSTACQASGMHMTPPTLLGGLAAAPVLCRGIPWGRAAHCLLLCACRCGRSAWARC